MKRWLLFLALIGHCVILNSLEVIHIAPFYYIDEVKDEVHPDNYYYKKLFQKLQGVETGFDLIFSLSSLESGQNPPQSLAEAIRVCRNENANYLLYGYIAEREYTLYAEIKLLDYNKRSLITTFYSVDDLKNSERIFDDLVVKILTFTEDTFNLQILKHEPEYSEWWFYSKIGYWTPIGSDWTRLIIGTFLAEPGIRFVPKDRLGVSHGFSLALSVGLEVSYQFGLGNPDRYDAYDHILTIGLPVRLHVKFNAQHGISTGLGLLYTFDLLQFKDPYDDMVLKTFNSFGNSLLLGYDFRVRDKISITADNQFELHYYQKLRFSYSLRIGIDYRISKKEIVKKW